MPLRPMKHLENRRQKCKMHTQERQLTRFFVFYNWSTKKTEPTVFQNRTELEKSILHIPSKRNLKAYLSEDLLVFKEIDEVGFYLCIGFVYHERWMQRHLR